MKNMHTDGQVSYMLKSFLLYALCEELIKICCFCSWPCRRWCQY